MGVLIIGIMEPSGRCLWMLGHGALGAAHSPGEGDQSVSQAADVESEPHRSGGGLCR